MKTKTKDSKTDFLKKESFMRNEGMRSSDQRMRSSSEGMRSSDQRMRSSNEGMRSSDQRIRLSNEGMRSSDQRMRSSNQRMRSFEIFKGLDKAVSRTSIEKGGVKSIILMATGGVDFIPASNPLFDPWQKNFVIKVNSFISGWAINEDGLAEWANLTGTGNVKQIRWDTAWAKISSKQFTHADEVEMLAARKTYESGDKANPDDTSLRIWITRYVRNNKKVTDKQKSDCGLTVPKDGATATNPDTVKAMEEAEMVISVKDSKHLLHVCKITQNKKSVAMGPDVSEISVYIAITTADVKVPPALSVFGYAGAAKRGLYTQTFTGEQVDMRAWYITRKKYKGKTQKLGTPSVAATAIII
jgi:hypothetical protein